MAPPKTTQNLLNGHPSGDERYTTLDKTMNKYNFEQNALIEVLNSAQELFGYLSRDLLFYVAQKLNVPMSRVYGVSSFYHLFKFEPLGDHNCTICTGTACHVKGADLIKSALAEAYHVKPGETTEDNSFSLNEARCLGSCGLAPVVVLDGEIIGKSTPKEVIKRVAMVLEQ